MTSDLEVNDLDKKIIRQVEFYFGDYNLHRDKFMKEEMVRNDGWFSMDTMLKFQRLSSICSEPGTILAALLKSKNNLLEVDVENQQIRRKPSKPVPDNNEKYRQDLKMRTVYIKGFPQNETIENITEFLEDYGTVEGVHLRRFNNPHTGAAFKGSLFATFSKLEEATKFLEAPMVYYQEKQLEKKTKEAFWKEKEAENAERLNKKRRKKGEKPTAVTEQKPEDEYSFVQVSNLEEDTTITHIHIKELLIDLGAQLCKFFSRHEKDGPTGYILFDSKNAAGEMLQLLKSKNEGTENDAACALVKSTKVKFEEATPEQHEQALQKYYEFRGFNKQGKRKGGRNDNRKKGKRQHEREHVVFDENGAAAPAKQAKLSATGDE